MSAPCAPGSALEYGDEQVRSALHDLLEHAPNGPDDLESELERLEHQYQGAVYSELIHLLSNLRIEKQDAKRHWTQIKQHRLQMERLLGTTVDPRVALLDYFVTVNRWLKNPTVIEMKLFDKAQESAYRDELTGLYNFRFFSEHLAREIARSERSNAALSLAVIDVDDFKHYNDRNGHAVGNEALKEVARLLSESLRAEDISARYGGEEFALILPATTKIGARNLAEVLCRKISKHRFSNGAKQPGGGLSVSIGIATLPADAVDADELLRRADHAMYCAKAGGKNQVQLYGQSSRSHRRVQASLDGNFRLLSEKAHPLTTLSVGDGGLLFVADSSLLAGSPIEIELKLPESECAEPFFGRVIYAKRTECGRFEVAVSLDDRGDAKWRLLGQFAGLCSTA